MVYLQEYIMIIPEYIALIGFLFGYIFFILMQKAADEAKGIYTIKLHHFYSI
jgi:hypothetical protein